ncbi:hypothetical protein ACFSL4_01700 [Streptomyces caeni]|uniref:PRL2-8 n=1 Tax=Streptomyces caeni TaxID=2307231 RepID=A0ABW4ILF5_9ACTN
MGVPFGWKKRDLAGEVMAATARSHDAGNCPICYPDAYRSRPAPEDSHQG